MEQQRQRLQERQIQTFDSIQCVKVKYSGTLPMTDLDKIIIQKKNAQKDINHTSTTHQQ